MSEFSSEDFVDKEGNVVKGSICFDYTVDSYYDSLMRQAISITITLVNAYSRNFLVSLIEWIGYSTRTMQIQAITLVIFITQFFNTAIILLLVNANTRD